MKSTMMVSFRLSAAFALLLAACGDEGNTALVAYPGPDAAADASHADAASNDAAAPDASTEAAPSSDSATPDAAAPDAGAD
jgi:hypothetical protein